MKYKSLEFLFSGILVKISYDIFIKTVQWYDNKYNKNNSRNTISNI